MTNIPHELSTIIHWFDQRIQHVTNQVNKIKQQTADPIIISHSLPDGWEKLIAARIEKRLLEKNQLLIQQLEQSQQKLAELETVQIPHLQNQIKQLEDKITFLQKHGMPNTPASHPIVFQEFSIEQVFLDKYEQTTNLGQLGIKEVTGKLHIGNAYTTASDLTQSEEESQNSGQSEDTQEHEDTEK
ncbi:hypothetical protein AC623_04835 [Bacillus sp. FJAT-27231]|uniref:hypothetical protein n=1 Tax=Bacillus sp. FJAT-27231 TaxID=1679168 RepID=UPI000670F16F|nr:hypothetical protein [Bacillus sp. FJAT-27231]KMY53393.1 hypothetical protein AC623_04835 [Bacillus sp. FJAT-27231]